MDYDIQKAAYDARFKWITDEVNRIHSAKIEERQRILGQLLRQDVSEQVIFGCGFTAQEVSEIRKKIQ